MPSQISIDKLKPDERKAIEKFLQESYALYTAAGLQGMPFSSWLNLLSQGIHEALDERIKKGINSK